MSNHQKNFPLNNRIARRIVFANWYTGKYEHWKLLCMHIFLFSFLAPFVGLLVVITQKLSLNICFKFLSSGLIAARCGLPLVLCFCVGSGDSPKRVSTCWEFLGTECWNCWRPLWWDFPCRLRGVGVVCGSSCTWVNLVKLYLIGKPRHTKYTNVNLQFLIQFLF